MLFPPVSARNKKTQMNQPFRLTKIGSSPNILPVRLPYSPKPRQVRKIIGLKTGPFPRS